MKVYIDGRDDAGWHLDAERKNLQASLRRLGFDQANGLLSADVVHNLCWYTVLDAFRFPIIRMKKRVLLTASNFIALDDPHYGMQAQYERLKALACAWIAPSSTQKNVLEKHGLRVFYQPFFLDLHVFKPCDAAKEQLLEGLRIPRERVKGRLIIGSFQRDSLGSDLTKAKWQKGPELLIEVLKALPSDRYLLLLAGPRRHYVIRECKAHNIPYYYYGRETDADDLNINIATAEEMPRLYSLCDIYLVTSTSEGGPKAVMEAAATKTFVLSTDVGLASDFLNARNILRSASDYVRRLRHLVATPEGLGDAARRDIEEQYDRCVGLLAYEAMDRRLLQIYEDVMGRELRTVS